MQHIAGDSNRLFPKLLNEMINGLHVCSEILEQQSLVFRLHMETIILIYSSRLENEVNNLTLENTKSLMKNNLPLFILYHSFAVLL